jgi:hypothetical protein
MRVLAVSALLLALAATPCAYAAEPFSLTASGGGTTITAVGDNMVDLAGNLIDAEDQFAALENENISGTLRYGGLNNAVLFTRNAAGTNATLTIPSTGFSRTFTAANDDELEDEMRDFFEKEGAGAYADFLAEINKQTSLGVNDGNPLATTALLADMGFYRFGFITRRPGAESIPLPVGLDLRITGGVSEADAGNDDDEELSGSFAALGLGTSIRFGDRVALTWANAFRYREVEGAAIYQYGTTLALPIALIPGNEGGLSWRVTPAFVGGFGGSWDMAAGGILVGGQITNSLSIHARGWTFSMGNQIGFYEGVPIEFSDFRFETDTSQVIVKNGLQVVRDLGDRAFVDAGLAYTSLLDDAFVEDYFSPSVGVGFRLGGSVLRIGYYGDIADEFTAHGANASLVFSY